MSQDERLRHFPVAFFATIMGTAGLTIAWQRGEQLFALGGVVSGL